MSVFSVCVVFILSLIAISFGAILLVLAKARDDLPLWWASVIGWGVVFFAVLSLAWSSVYCFKYWRAGYFELPAMYAAPMRAQPMSSMPQRSMPAGRFMPSPHMMSMPSGFSHQMPGMEPVNLKGACVVGQKCDAVEQAR